MKNILFLIFISCFTLSSYSKENPFICYKWEGISIDGHSIFGLSKTKEQAQVVINDFNKRNAKTKFKIHSYIIRKTTLEKSSFDLFFERYTKQYRVLKKIDIAIIRLFQISNFEKVVAYISDITKKSNKDATMYAQRLLKECKLYRLPQNGL